ncbi:MAG: 2-hydroxyacyl-CoA dehydratase [Planctomycetota bacterium]|jgi:benzoyl-CoA reductase/2-hydroxyglutaryl-CoA dehydratase subunit BcrC/BadD/HgdB
MNNEPRQITLSEWDEHYEHLQKNGLREPNYGGRLSRHVEYGDQGLLKLRYDNSAAALRLWNFLLTEEQRLHKARVEGKKIVGTMKDLGTVPVMAYSLDNVVAFYPDGAWWIPCVMELGAGLLEVADSVGIDESFCPVRAMLGAFITEAHFPIPDQLICSVGATCDDFSAIAQRLSGLGYHILWWEIPHRRRPESDEVEVKLPGGFSAPKSQVEFVKSELHRIKNILEELTGECLDEEKLSAGIQKANQVRRYLAELRQIAFTAELCPIGALEMLIAEMLAIHFCSDQDETIIVLTELVDEVKNRVRAGKGVLNADVVRIFWVNPVADLQVMNLLEGCGGRICGTEYLFTHALDLIPQDVPPWEALAMMALADPMTGSSVDRAERICADIDKFGSEAVLISRIPGASHCAIEGQIIAEIIQAKFKIPVLEIEVPPLTDSIHPTLCTRMEALIETVKMRRKK